jgi:transcriptional regulator with XRE-family HTH domain
MQRSNLYKARLSHELSQDELANLVGVTARQIRRYEEGISMPSERVIMRLAEALDVTPSYLLGLVDDPGAHFSYDDLSPMEREFMNAFHDPARRPILELLVRMVGHVIGDDEDTPIRLPNMSNPLLN